MKTTYARTAISCAAYFGAAAFVLAISALPVIAQELEELIEENAVPQFGVVGYGAYTFQGDADIDGGGSMQVNRYSGTIAGQTDLIENLRWTNTFFIGADSYDFDGGGFAAGRPWQDILSMRLGTRLRYQLNQEWGVWAGGVFEFAPETGANWGKSFTGGGQVGGDYTFSETLFVSVGIAVLTQIEEDPKVTPSVGLNWLPHEQWAVRVGAVPVSGGIATGAEVAYRVAEPVTIGLGLLYKQHRFRLDDSGVAPEGVGQENTLPLRLRVGWDITKNISVHLLGGVALAGELELDNRNGNQLSSKDYDPAAYFGVRILAGI